MARGAGLRRRTGERVVYGPPSTPHARQALKHGRHSTWQLRGRVSERLSGWTVGRSVVRAYEHVETTASAAGGDLF
jgi:hypothetical protein